LFLFDKTSPGQASVIGSGTDKDDPNQTITGGGGTLFMLGCDVIGSPGESTSLEFDVGSGCLLANANADQIPCNALPGTFTVNCSTNQHCDDSDLCTVDSCNLSTGQCSNAAKSCDDSNLCTTDTCDPGSGQCSNIAKSCDDGNHVNGDGCSSDCTIESDTRIIIGYEPSLTELTGGSGSIAKLQCNVVGKIGDVTNLELTSAKLVDSNGDGIPLTTSSCTLTVKPQPGDLDYDGDVDMTDMNILLTYRNKPASACPECDLDGDGMITVLDGRKLILLCTRPRCATQ
jgi:cysteine-rich repeat protein